MSRIENQTPSKVEIGENAAYENRSSSVVIDSDDEGEALPWSKPIAPCPCREALLVDAHNLCAAVDRIAPLYDSDGSANAGIESEGDTSHQHLLALRTNRGKSQAMNPLTAPS